jgi:D-arabinose 1-dehydrogenase-like Zn-dependent alcohol dehydrogenase
MEHAAQKVTGAPHVSHAQRDNRVLEADAYVGGAVTQLRAGDVEIIPVEAVNRACERIRKGDVRYRFVIDMASLR